MFNHKPKHRGAKAGVQPAAPVMTESQRLAAVEARIEEERRILRIESQKRFDEVGLPRYDETGTVSAESAL